MSFFKKLSSLFSPPRSTETGAFWVTAKCNRCGEIIRARINLNNDLSVDYEGSKKPVYYCRKILMGEGHCFQRLEVELTFDADKRLIDRQISGGQFVEDK